MLVSGIIITSLLVLIITLSLAAFATPGQGEGFSEIYFVGNLPKQAQMDLFYNFTFAIHNLEGQSADYNYSILLPSNKVLWGELTLDHEDTAFITDSFRGRGEFGRVKITLENRDQEIHFWVRPV